MKARSPKLNLDQLAIECESVDVHQFILQECSTYQEAAEFFRVDRSTIGRWMMGTIKPHPSCYTAVAAYRLLQRAA